MFCVNFVVDKKLFILYIGVKFCKHFVHWCLILYIIFSQLLNMAIFASK